VLEIDPELIWRLRVGTWSIISEARRSVINRLFSSVHVTPSLSTQSPVYLPAWLPKRLELASVHISLNASEAQQGTAGRLNAPRVCGHIMATSWQHH